MGRENCDCGSRRWVGIGGALAISLQACGAASPILFDSERTRSTTVVVGGSTRAVVAQSGNSSDFLPLATAEVAPVIGGSVPVGDRVSASLRYRGRDISFGGLFSLWTSREDTGASKSLLVGVEGRWVLVRPSQNGLHSVRGGGGSVPLLFAIQSDSGIYGGYLGGTFGLEWLGAVRDFNGLAQDITGRRLTASATLGFSLGFRKIHALVELSVDRDWINGKIGDSSANAQLWSLAPAFALSFRP